YVDERDVEMDPLLSEQSGNFAQKDGRVIGNALVDSLANVRPDEKGVVTKMVEQLFRGVGRFSESEDVNDFDIKKVRAFFAECLDEKLWRRATGTDKHSHSIAQF